jgi:hypothetical protein
VPTTEDVSVAAFTGAAKTIDAIAVSGIVNLRENVMLLIHFGVVALINSPEIVRTLFYWTLD